MNRRRRNDLINGGSGYDRLRGGDGDDATTGGLGLYHLKGGVEADRFGLAFGEATHASQPVTDHAVDFNRAEIDRVDLSAIHTLPGLGGNQAFVFRGKVPVSDSVG